MEEISGNNNRNDRDAISDITQEQEQLYSLFARSEQHALEWSAVLDSQNIPYMMHQIDGGEGVLFILSEKNFRQAIANIDAYESERSFFERFQELYSSSSYTPIRFKRAVPTVFIVAVFTLFYFFSGPAEMKNIWHTRGMLSAKFFSDLQWWNPVTALTLHADFSHLAGNMLFFLVFGTAAAVQAGAGASLFFILLSGVLGNLTTLWIFGDRVYNALGFSTAVFGILGMLAVLKLMENLRTTRILSVSFWIPLLAATAIFGLTGGSGGSDLSGHFFGFLWGGILGVPLHFIAKYRKNMILQGVMFFSSLAIVVTAWYYAIHAA